MILGAVIAGGRASRFGSDKALADVAGRPMIEHVLSTLSANTDATVVCGRTHPGWTHVADRPRSGLGPLAGIAAALHHGATHGFALVLTAPCDTPSIKQDLIDALRQEPGPACIAGCPIIGVWPCALGISLDRFLATGGRRSVHTWAHSVGATLLVVPAPVNVNRPDDLAALGG